MITYTVKTNRNIQVRALLAFKSGAQTIKYDFSPWQTDNGTVTAVTWTVKSGQASITNKSLASSIASALITTSETGNSMIKIQATAGNNIFVTYLKVTSKDPMSQPVDYGLCSC